MTAFATLVKPAAVALGLFGCSSGAADAAGLLLLTSLIGSFALRSADFWIDLGPEVASFGFESALPAPWMAISACTAGFLVFFLLFTILIRTHVSRRSPFAGLALYAVFLSYSALLPIEGDVVMALAFFLLPLCTRDATTSAAFIVASSVFAPGLVLPDALENDPEHQDALLKSPAFLCTSLAAGLVLCVAHDVFALLLLPYLKHVAAVLGLVVANCVAAAFVGDLVLGAQFDSGLVSGRALGDFFEERPAAVPAAEHFLGVVLPTLTAGVCAALLLRTAASPLVAAGAGGASLAAVAAFAWSLTGKAAAAATPAAATLAAIVALWLSARPAAAHGAADEAAAAAGQALEQFGHTTEPAASFSKRVWFSCQYVASAAAAERGAARPAEARAAARRSPAPREAPPPPLSPSRRGASGVSGPTSPSKVLSGAFVAGASDAVLSMAKEAARKSASLELAETPEQAAALRAESARAMGSLAESVRDEQTKASHEAATWKDVHAVTVRHRLSTNTKAKTAGCLEAAAKLADDLESEVAEVESEAAALQGGETSNGRQAAAAEDAEAEPPPHTHTTAGAAESPKEAEAAESPKEAEAPAPAAAASPAAVVVSSGSPTLTELRSETSTAAASPAPAPAAATPSKAAGKAAATPSPSKATVASPTSSEKKKRKNVKDFFSRSLRALSPGGGSSAKKAKKAAALARTATTPASSASSTTFTLDVPAGSGVGIGFSSSSSRVIKVWDDGMAFGRVQDGDVLVSVDGNPVAEGDALNTLQTMGATSPRKLAFERRGK